MIDLPPHDTPSSSSLMLMAEKVIKTLMSDSHWAKDQTIASLTQALRNETDEFITSFELRDKLNVFSEAGDVLMILLCCLQHQFGATTEQMLPRVLDEIVKKLRRRFSHLYASSQKEGNLCSCLCSMIMR